MDEQSAISTQSSAPAAWTPYLIAILPLAYWAADLATGGNHWPVYLGITVALCLFDIAQVQKAGYPLGNAWIVLVPVYLWKRATLTHQSKLPTWIWVGGLVASIAVPAALSAGVDKETACELVTEILQRDDQKAPTCKGVTILQDPGTGFVKASALLSDGSERTITIETKNDSISVQVLPR